MSGINKILTETVYKGPGPILIEVSMLQFWEDLYFLLYIYLFAFCKVCN